MRTLSDVRDGFLLSLWPCLGCAVSRCASWTPPDRILLDRLVPLRFSVLSVNSCYVTSFTASCVRILLRSPGLSSPPLLFTTVLSDMLCRKRYETALLDVLSVSHAATWAASFSVFETLCHGVVC